MELNRLVSAATTTPSIPNYPQHYHSPSLPPPSSSASFSVHLAAVTLVTAPHHHSSRCGPTTRPFLSIIGVSEVGCT